LTQLLAMVEKSGSAYLHWKAEFDCSVSAVAIVLQQMDYVTAEEHP